MLVRESLPRPHRPHPSTVSTMRVVCVPARRGPPSPLRFQARPHISPETPPFRTCLSASFFLTSLKNPILNRLPMDDRQLSPQRRKTLTRRVRLICAFFMIALILSGLTAIPIKWEVARLTALLAENTPAARLFPPLARWLSQIRLGLHQTGPNHDFLFYLTDWLAFGYIFIGLAFYGPLRDPVKNIWIINWAVILFAAAFPTILISAHVRNIPLFWQLFDLSSALLGLSLLLLTRHYIKQLQ